MFFKKHKQENEHEFQDVGMNRIGHGGLTHDVDKEAIIPITKASGQRASELLRKAMNQTEMPAVRIEFDSIENIHVYIDGKEMKVGHVDLNWEPGDFNRTFNASAEKEIKAYSGNEVKPLAETAAENSGRLKHIKIRSEHKKSEIRKPRVNEVITDINNAISSSENGEDKISITLSGYALNSLEEQYVINELRQAKYNCDAIFGGNEIVAIVIHLDKPVASN